MIEKHKAAFARAAKQFNCIIKVLVPNPLSAQYFGWANYVPKPMWCKAKTSDVENHPSAGLVVDPIKCPEAFTHKRLVEAEKEWQEFQVILDEKVGFTTNEVRGHRHYGCILFHGSYLYSDYDLHSIEPWDRNAKRPEIRNLTPANHYRSLEQRLHRTVQKFMKDPLVPLTGREEILRKSMVDSTTDLERQVRDFILPRVGVDLIQHGGSKNVGRSLYDECHLFNPIVGYAGIVPGGV